MAEHWLIFFRSISAFVLLLFITRMIGKQTLSSMNIHDFVTAIILGAIAANFAFNEKIQSAHLLISLAVFTGTSWLLSFAALKYRKIRKWLFGTPSVLIEGGVIMETNMKKNKFTLDSLNEMLREKEIFNIHEVEYALLENNGKVSILRKPEYRALTLHTLASSTPSRPTYPIELIMDGNLIMEHLREANMSITELERAVQQKGRKMTEVFYAVRGTDQSLYFDFYQDELQQPVDID